MKNLRLNFQDKESLKRLFISVNRRVTAHLFDPNRGVEDIHLGYCVHGPADEFFILFCHSRRYVTSRSYVAKDIGW